MTSYEDTLPETEEITEEAEKEETDWRESFIEMVKKLDGMGTYHFGSKASVSDKEAVSSYINGSMETEDLTLQLDCSGFVQLMYWVWTGECDPDLSSTYLIQAGCTRIDETELKPGDLGMLFADGSYSMTPDGQKLYEPASVEQWISEGEGRSKKDLTRHTNHVGIYLGTDSDGNKLWIHCNAKSNGISIDVMDQFTCFYRVME